MPPKKIVAFSLLGSRLDAGFNDNRWSRWRPSVALAMQDDLLIDRLELLYDRPDTSLARLVAADVVQVSPQTEVRHHHLHMADPWEFEEVFATLHDFARDYPFDTDAEDYLVHISTGTHVAQICLFLLIETRRFPGRMIQTSPQHQDNLNIIVGTYRIIDLDLSRYDRIASRFRDEIQDQVARLKSGIQTKNEAFNRIIERINQVAIASTAPVLLTGPTGAGKSQLARRIYELKRQRRLVTGELVEVNCATIRGDGAMSALFGHRRGSFTGAQGDRPGLLKTADGGLLFLDEIGELGLDEQAMLLRALEGGTFLPVGADREVTSHFQLLAGTNRELAEQVRVGRFRADLLARINLWHFRLPGLAQRREDIEPNLDYELDQVAVRTGRRITFSREARAHFLAVATSPTARWTGNFRDLNGAVQRMTTLSSGGRISEEVVAEELVRLQQDWDDGTTDPGEVLLLAVLGEEAAAALDRFDRVQLADVLQVCLQASSLSEAGRTLFAVSRTQRQSVNDADRLRKYLARFSLDWAAICAARRE